MEYIKDDYGQVNQLKLRIWQWNLCSLSFTCFEHLLVTGYSFAIAFEYLFSLSFGWHGPSWKAVFICYTYQHNINVFFF